MGKEASGAALATASIGRLAGEAGREPVELVEQERLRVGDLAAVLEELVGEVLVEDRALPADAANIRSAKLVVTVREGHDKAPSQAAAVLLNAPFTPGEKFDRALEKYRFW